MAMQSNGRQLAELRRRHAADRKQSSKQLKKEWRNSRQAFCDRAESVRRTGVVGDQERIRLRQVCVCLPHFSL